MSTLGLDLTKNLSYFTVPAAFLVSHVSHMVAAASSGKAYDNGNPKNFESNLKNSQTLDKATKERTLRLKYAANNGLETLGFFAASVVAANQAGVEIEALNKLSIGYVISRLVYTLYYANTGEDIKLSVARSGLWVSGIFCIVGLWVKAGLKVAQ
ncbi:hypothetical protein Golomagni_06643 [Golovinomyces magnicellulatus]|nr:hypothetical protein Golomagni_06643 [Golovinomyces magnicellulatus]